MQQPLPLLTLLRRVRQETSLSVLVFTGYTWEEIQRRSAARALLACVDVLVAGRYDDSQGLAPENVNERFLRSSANQTVHLLTDRYRMDDLRSVPTAEVIITVEGEVVVSGVEPNYC